MKNKFLMLITVAAIAIGITGCSFTTPPAQPLSESGQTNYRDFSQTEFAKIRGKQKFILFFHAQWCPTCRAWEKKIIQIASELPATATILKADYDNESELKEEFGINTQSTAVFFDKNGKVIETIIDPSMDKVKDFFLKTGKGIMMDGVKINDKIIKDDGNKMMREKLMKDYDEKIRKDKMMDDKDMMNKEDMMGHDEMGPAKYVDYSAKIRKELAGKKHLIFFYANWCSVCKAWDKELKNNLSNMPAGTVVLKADYDNENELKKEFGISTQSTAVFINEDGTFEVKIDPKMEIVKEFFAK